MRLIKRRRTKFVAAVVGVIALTVAASRQLYLYLLNANGLTGAQGSRYHLWLALGALSMTCVAGALTFFFFLGSEEGGSGLRDA